MPTSSYVNRKTNYALFQHGFDQIFRPAPHLDACNLASLSVHRFNNAHYNEIERHSPYSLGSARIHILRQIVIKLHASLNRRCQYLYGSLSSGPLDHHRQTFCGTRNKIEESSVAPPSRLYTASTSASNVESSGYGTISIIQSEECFEIVVIPPQATIASSLGFGGAISSVKASVHVSFFNPSSTLKLSCITASAFFPGLRGISCTSPNLSNSSLACKGVPDKCHQKAPLAYPDSKFIFHSLPF